MLERVAIQEGAEIAGVPFSTTPSLLENLLEVPGGHKIRQRTLKAPK
jgi:hypothetical protein